MIAIRKFDKIAESGLAYLPLDKYKISTDEKNPSGIILRSYKLQGAELGDQLWAIARAGAGVNNIPVSLCTERGIVVFNTPGANANAVKELVLSGLLMSSRKIVESIQAVKELPSDGNLPKAAEKLKSQFAGPEISGKTLGIVGLGAIGGLLSEAALDLGMKVIGFDPYLSIQAAWRMPRKVVLAKEIEELLQKADYISLHVPLTESTREWVNAGFISKMKKGMRLLNFARPEIVAVPDVLDGMKEGHIGYYVTDFADPRIMDKENILVMPHLGASTQEAEENCAMMACEQIRDFMEEGNIKNSVNFPEVHLKGKGSHRLSIVNKNIPKMIGRISDAIGEEGLNIADMANNSLEELAYTLIDLDSKPSEGLLQKLENLDGVIRLRVMS